MDYHDLHPGFKMNLLSAVRLAFALPMIDVLEELLRKIRPYEKVAGSAEKAFEEGMDYLVNGLEGSGISGARKGFRKAVDRMAKVEYDRSSRIKEQYPDAQILPLDYDPDVSFANIENRLQMLVMNIRDTGKEETKKSVRSEAS